MRQDVTTTPGQDPDFFPVAVSASVASLPNGGYVEVRDSQCLPGKAPNGKPIITGKTQGYYLRATWYYQNGTQEYTYDEGKARPQQAGLPPSQKNYACLANHYDPTLGGYNLGSRYPMTPVVTALSDTEIRVASIYWPYEDFKEFKKGDNFIKVTSIKKNDEQIPAPSDVLRFNAGGIFHPHSLFDDGSYEYLQPYSLSIDKRDDGEFIISGIQHHVQTQSGQLGTYKPSPHTIEVFRIQSQSSSFSKIPVAFIKQPLSIMPGYSSYYITSTSTTSYPGIGVLFGSGPHQDDYIVSYASNQKLYASFRYSGNPSDNASYFVKDPFSGKRSVIRSKKVENLYLSTWESRDNIYARFFELESTFVTSNTKPVSQPSLADPGFVEKLYHTDPDIAVLSDKTIAIVWQACLEGGLSCEFLMQQYQKQGSEFVEVYPSQQSLKSIYGLQDAFDPNNFPLGNGNALSIAPLSHNDLAIHWRDQNNVIHRVTTNQGVTMMQGKAPPGSTSSSVNPVNTVSPLIQLFALLLLLPASFSICYLLMKQKNSSAQQNNDDSKKPSDSTRKADEVISTLKVRFNFASKMPENMTVSQKQATEKMSLMQPEHKSARAFGSVV